MTLSDLKLGVVASGIAVAALIMGGSNDKGPAVPPPARADEFCWKDETCPPHGQWWYFPCPTDICGNIQDPEKDCRICVC